MAGRELSVSPFVLYSELQDDWLTFRIGKLHPLLPIVWIMFLVWAVTLSFILIGRQWTVDPGLADALKLVAFACIVLALLLASWLTGKETLRFDGPELEVVNQAIGLRRVRRFRLTEIEQVAVEPRPIWVMNIQLEFPFAIGRHFGAIAFDYQGRKVLLLPRISEAQAGMVVGWLKNRLSNA
jgi:hypothetical protein